MKITLILLLICNILFAHPHTFIEVYPNVSIHNDKITKISFQWKLDEMSSSMLIMELDQNGDGKIDKDENTFIYENYFMPLVDYNFYTDISIQEKVKRFPTPSNFKALIKNNRLYYNFDITNLQLDIHTTKFDFGDTDFFVAMILKKEFVTINERDAKVSDLDNDFYFGYRMEIQ